MKITFFLLPLVFLSNIILAQKSEVTILSKVLTDSIVYKYMTEYGGIDDKFMLSHKTGNYSFNKGTVGFENNTCENKPHFSGIIKKIKIKKQKAVVKIYFKNEQSFYTKIKLNKDHECLPWRVKTRLIYSNFPAPIKQQDIFFYSLN